MFICNKCKTELEKKGISMHCRHCRNSITIHNDIIYFHPDVSVSHETYDSGWLDLLHKYEDEYFWFIHRKKIINKIFNKYIGNEDLILEIGAGTGNIASMLMKSGYRNIAVGDIHKNGLEYAKQYGIDKLYQFDLTRAPFMNHFDVVAMFDVLEHIPDDRLAVANIHQILKTNGKLVLTVPAYQFLWSSIDAFSKHFRRYKEKTLRQLLETNGFRIIYSGNCFLLIMPLLLLRSLIFNIVPQKQIKSEKQVGLKINSIINTILRMICNIEYIVSKLVNIKFGGSIIVVAEKIGI